MWNVQRSWKKFTSTFNNLCYTNNRNKTISKYVLVKFGRVKLNYEKVTFTVTLPEINNVLGYNLKLEAWVEHTGATIKSGHYVLIRRMEEGCIKISDANITSYSPNYIESCQLCYIAFLRRL